MMQREDVFRLIVERQCPQALRLLKQERRLATTADRLRELDELIELVRDRGKLYSHPALAMFGAVAQAQPPAA